MRYYYAIARQRNNNQWIYNLPGGAESVAGILAEYQEALAMPNIKKVVLIKSRAQISLESVKKVASNL